MFDDVVKGEWFGEGFEYWFVVFFGDGWFDFGE